MPNTSLIIETLNNEAIVSVTDATIAALPAFVQGDTHAFRVYLVRASAGTTTLTRIPTVGLDIQMAIGRKVGNASTLYTQQFTWTASTDLADPYWSASLPMDTAAITTLLGANDHASAWFEVKLFEDGVPTTILSKSVQVQAAVIKTGSVTEPAVPTPLSAEVASATFVSKSGIVGGLNITSPDGTVTALIWLGNDGVLHCDPLS